MTDLINEQIAAKLRDIIRDDRPFSLKPDVQRRVAALADQLDPPKAEYIPKRNDWVHTPNDGIAWVVKIHANDPPYPVMVEQIGPVQDDNGDWREGRRNWKYEDVEVLSFDPLGIARLYREHKPLPGYISTAGLPELLEGCKYTGEFREPLHSEWFMDTDGRVNKKLVDGDVGMALIVGCKEAANAHC